MMKIALLPNNNHLETNGYSLSEEVEFYDAQLQDVLDNTRWYLDNLDYLVEYRVSWKKYAVGRSKITLPFRYIDSKKTLDI